MDGNVIDISTINIDTCGGERYRRGLRWDSGGRGNWMGGVGDWKKNPKIH